MLRDSRAAGQGSTGDEVQEGRGALEDLVGHRVLELLLSQREAGEPLQAHHRQQPFLASLSSLNLLLDLPFPSIPASKSLPTWNPLTSS